MTQSEGKIPDWVHTPQLSQSMEYDDLCSHRAQIAIELEVIAKKIDRDAWDRDRSKPYHNRINQDWIYALQDFTLKEIQRACQQAVEINPNRMPNEGHIKKIILGNRSKYFQIHKNTNAALNSNCGEERQKVTTEQAENILKEVGFDLKKMAGPDEG